MLQRIKGNFGLNNCRQQTWLTNQSVNWQREIQTVEIKIWLNRRTHCLTTFPTISRSSSKILRHASCCQLTSRCLKTWLNTVFCLIYYWKRFTTYLFRRFLHFVVSSSPGSSPTFPRDLPFHLSSAQPCLWGFLRINIQSTFRPFIKILFLILNYSISTDISHQLNWLFYLNNSPVFVHLHSNYF